MYTVKYNVGQGFTEGSKSFDSIKEACAYAVGFDYSQIYKNGKRIA